MQILSVNVALPQTVTIHGRPVFTAIDKRSVSGQITARTLGLDGDGQADHTVHGGVHQAIYAYAFEHYSHWQRYLGSETLAYGTFGENLTTSGLLETEVCIGDIFRCGTALLQVTAPRLPCFKFAHKIGNPAILKDFLHSGFCGFYFRVLEEGALAAGDPITLIHRPAHGITMRTMLGLQKLGEGTPLLIQEALKIENLNPFTKRDLEQRLVQRAV